MTKHQLFNRLCALADALQAEIAREDESAHKLALAAVVDQLDTLIDEIVDHPITNAHTKESALWDIPLPSVSPSSSSSPCLPGQRRPIT